MRYIFFLLLSYVAFAFAQSTLGNSTETCTKGRIFSGEYKSASGAYEVKWIIDCDKSEIEAVVTATATGWVAFGLNTDLNMPNAHVIQAYVTGNGSFEYRAAQNGNYAPPTALKLDIYSKVNGTQTENQTIIGFTRPLTVSPEFSIVPEGNNVIWAFQPTNDNFNSKHTMQSRGAVVINFFTGGSNAPKEGTNYRLIHGSIMLLAFGFLAPAGTFVARYLKAIGHTWYLIHITIQYVVLGLTLSAFIIIEQSIHSQLHNPHSIIGLTIVILTLIQVVIGIAANAMFRLDRTAPPVFPDKVHWYLGRLVILYAISNCFLGMHEYGFTGVHNSPFIIFATWIGVTITIFIITEVKTGQVHYVPIEPLDKFSANKFSIVIYVILFIVGIALYAATMSQMWRMPKN